MRHIIDDFSNNTLILDSSNYNTNDNNHNTNDTNHSNNDKNQR